MAARSMLRAAGEFPTAETDIVIEGFPRTGNTFAVVAFGLAQLTPVSIAHHVHAPAALIHAGRAGIPAIVLVREPEETILSFVLRYPHLSMAQALRGYARFYEPVLEHRAGLVIGRFDEVTTDLGAVISRVNQRHGTSFGEFEPTEGNLGRVREVVDEWDRNTFGEGERLERGRATPTEERARMKDRLRAAYRDAGLATARGRADRAYERMVAG